MFTEDKLRFTREDIDNILDIFQDIIDEYNLTKSKFGTSINGQYRLFDYHYNLSIWINIDELMHNDKFFLDIDNFKNRLKSEKINTRINRVPSTWQYSHYLLELAIEKDKTQILK